MGIRKYDTKVDPFPALPDFLAEVKAAGLRRVKVAERGEVIPKVAGATVVAQPYSIYTVTAYDKPNDRILKWERREEVGRGVLKPDGTFVPTAKPIVPRIDDIRSQIEDEDLAVEHGDWEREGIPVT